MLPITKLRKKTVTYRGEQRMREGIEHMKHAGWRVVTTSEGRVPTPSKRFPVLGRISSLLVKPRPHFTVTFTWP